MSDDILLFRELPFERIRKPVIRARNMGIKCGTFCMKRYQTPPLFLAEGDRVMAVIVTATDKVLAMRNLEDGRIYLFYKDLVNGYARKLAFLTCGAITFFCVALLQGMSFVPEGSFLLSWPVFFLSPPVIGILPVLWWMLGRHITYIRLDPDLRRPTKEEERHILYRLQSCMEHTRP